MLQTITCIECPIGCTIEAEAEGGAVVSVCGNGCPRGKAYAQSEATCPVRVVTSTVRTSSGKMVPVKTSAPVRKSEIFRVMKIINATHPDLPLHIGDVLVRDVDGYRIVDYKFSSHTDEELRARYAPQIALYRKAAARILNVEEGTIRASIVNIRLCREIAL